MKTAVQAKTPIRRFHPEPAFDRFMGKRRGQRQKGGRFTSKFLARRVQRAGVAAGPRLRTRAHHHRPSAPRPEGVNTVHPASGVLSPDAGPFITARLPFLPVPLAHENG